MTNLAGIVRDAQAARGEWLAVRQGELGADLRRACAGERPGCRPAA